MLLVLAILALVAGALFWFFAEGKRRSSGMPHGRVISSDTGGWSPVSKPFFDPELRLTGKPDYLVETGGKFIPVEVKSSRAPDAPYDSHVYQLAAYCMLVENASGVRPPYGILHYRDRTFAIDYTPGLKVSLLDLLEEMRRADQQRSQARSHELPQRCQRCGYRSTCDQAL